MFEQYKLIKYIILHIDIILDRCVPVGRSEFMAQYRPEINAAVRSMK